MFEKASTNHKRVTIIGPGRVGSSLLDGLKKAGYRIASVITRTGKPTLALREIQRAESPDFPMIRLEELAGGPIGHLVFITTPDDSISEVAERLASIHADWDGKVVAHASGFLNSRQLEPLRNKGARVASFQPLQTFTSGSGGDAFQGIHVTLEGNDEAIESLRQVAVALGSNPHPVTPEQKHALHVAAVFLSNYLVALAGISDRLIRDSIPGADFSWLEPLLARTASNLKIKTPQDALTGPLVRGDLGTVEKHLEVLEPTPDWNRLYRLLGQQALELIKKKGNLSEKRVKELEERMSENPA